MRNFLLIAFVFMASVNAQSQVVDFFREDLRFRLFEDRFEVAGNYYFRNNSSKPMVLKLKYPFPEDADFGKVEAVKCTDLSDSGNSIDFIKQEYLMFSVSIPAHEEKVYRIAYHHQLHGKRALYILTSTRQWGKPLEQATYKLIVENLHVDSLSYIPDKTEVFADSTRFFWKKSTFMPDKNFEVFFTKQKQSTKP